MVRKWSFDLFALVVSVSPLPLPLLVLEIELLLSHLWLLGRNPIRGFIKNSEEGRVLFEGKKKCNLIDLITN